MDNEVKPYGLIDPQGRFYDALDAKINKYPRGYRWGLYLDDTDDRRDPRIGYRVQYERWDMPQTREENSAFFQQDYNLTLFIPANDDHTKVWVVNYFESGASVSKEGKLDQSRYVCPPGAKAGCQAAIDQLYQRQLENAQMGKATTLGGANRLRGYRTNRFYDAFSAFHGLEYRWYIMETQNPFDFLIEKGVFAGLQLAFFLEEGTVAPTYAQLWAAKRESHGAAFRVIFNTVVVRYDVGFGDEGQQHTLFFGYPF
jgi:outer membrane protein assembly factor BamA